MKLSCNSIIFLVLRSDSHASFLREAFGCVPCSVRVLDLSNERISEIIIRLKERSKSRTKPIIPKKEKNEEDGIDIHAREFDFVPPVPVPVKFAEVGTMDHDCE